MRKLTFFWILAIVISVSVIACKGTEETTENETTTTEQDAHNDTTSVANSDTAQQDSLNNDTLALKKDSLFMSYERTPCFGRCEIFEVKIYDSGYMIYEGVNFVNNIGKYHGRLSQEQINTLKQTIDSIDYFSFESEYDNQNVTDLPSVITYVSMEGKEKKIRNRYRGPQELNRLYEKLDLFLDSTMWKPLEDKE